MRMTTDEIVIWVIVALSALTLTLVAVNCMSSKVSGESAPYEYHYTYCSRSACTMRFCSTCDEYKSASETRIDVHMTGILWDYNNYRVVR